MSSARLYLIYNGMVTHILPLLNIVPDCTVQVRTPYVTNFKML